MGGKQGGRGSKARAALVTPVKLPLLALAKILGLPLRVGRRAVSPAASLSLSAQPAEAACASSAPRRASSGKSWAPCEVCPRSTAAAAPPGGGAACHQLVATGTKVWGVGPLFPLARLYDYAVYLDSRQAAHWPLGRRLLAPGPAADGSRAPPPAQRPELWRALRSAGCVEMTLVVRASRNLPIRLLRAEYERILRRRLGNVGGSSGDPSLSAVLDAFREESLPAAIKSGGSVRKGTTLTFVKRSDGSLSAAADGTPISAVRSDHLCAAVFDLYLGDQPVSKKARASALQRVADLLQHGVDSSGNSQQGPVPCGLTQYSWELAH